MLTRTASCRYCEWKGRGGAGIEREGVGCERKGRRGKRGRSMRGMQ